MLIGASEAQITPPVGIPLVGTLQPSTGVHDDLFARALVLGDGERSVAIVCLDLVGLDFSLADDIRAEVQRRTCVMTTLLNCTHTHSAPFTVPWSVLGWEGFQREGRQWRAELVAKVADAVARAAASVQNAVLRVGRAPVQIGMNRRLSTPRGIVMQPNPVGAVAPWVDVLRVDDGKGNPIAVLFSHAAHAVVVHGASTLISADYPGYAVAAVRRELGGEVLPMFAQACGANINAAPLRGGFEAAERAGSKLGEAAAQAALDAEPIPASQLSVRSLSLALPLQDLPARSECERALRAAEDRLAEARKTGENGGRLWYQRDEVLRLRDLLARAERGERQELRFDVHALTFGREWCLLTMTHEVFVEYQLWADRVLPFHRTMVLAYTNGCESYVPTDADFALGGYEAGSFPQAKAAALAYRYRVALKPGAEKRLREAITSVALE